MRFPGFEGEWKEIGFKQLFRYIPHNTLSRAKLNYKSGEFKNIHYGDVLIKFGFVLDIETNSLPFINAPVSNKYEQALLIDGDIIIADTAEDETVGKATEIINVGNHKVVSGLHTIACRPNIKMASTYLGFYINSEVYHKQLIALMQGVKVLSVSKSNIEKTFIVYPEIAEQKKICTMLNLIEKKIQKKCQLIENLKKYKRGVVKSLLNPQKNDWQGVTWTTDTIGNLGTFIKGAALSKADISDSGTPFILYGELYTTYKEVVRSVVRKTQA